MDLTTPFSGSTRSPQADLIDNLIWSNLGSFWTDAYKPDDKDALSAIYESMFTVLDAEYVRLFEINQAKSVIDCPVYTQRRWARLDMNKYDQVKAFLQFLRGGTASLQHELPGNTLACADVPTLHTHHWHIRFPWTIPNIAPDLRGLINLALPINSIALVDVYKIQEGADGIRRGKRQMPRTAPDSVDWDFELMPDGTTIHILNPAVNAQYEIMAAFDFSGESYLGLRPRVFKVENFLSSNICQVPDSMSTGLPVHALVVRNPPDLGTSGLEVTNREDFNTSRIFLPYGETQHGSQGKVVLPADFLLHVGDIVFIFGLEAGDFDTIHVHHRDSAALEQSDLISGLITDYSPGVQVPLGLFGSIDFLGQQLELFVNGLLIHPGDYSYEYASNTFFFRHPISGSVKGKTFIDVLYTEELRGTAGLAQPFHVHQQCSKGNVQVPHRFGTFDDGGTFDDVATDPPALFDDYTYDNTVFIEDIVVNADQVEVFIDGVLLELNVHYIVSPEYKRTRVTFFVAVNGKSILVSIIRKSLIYSYGLDDIVPGTSVYGISTSTLHNILSDLQNIITQFETVFGSKVSDLATLLEAAFIAAGGGNPLLALFLDEFKEYDGLPLDSPNQFLTAIEARTVESQNIKLIDIPFLVDTVLNPTVRLDGGGAQFQVINGNIQSSVDLTGDTITAADAGSENSVPANAGIWWCPLVLLDESMLAKNFGALVDDVRPDSSLAYKNALISNLMLRYGGPTMQSISRAAAILLGSEMFTQDSKVISIVPEITSYAITITASQGERQEIFVVSATAPLPELGAPVYPGQSVAFPIIVNTSLPFLESWSPGVLTVNFDLGMIQKGDRARITVYDPNDSRARPISVEMHVIGVHTRPVLSMETTVQTVIKFDQAIKYIVTKESVLHVFRDFGSPRAGFEGTVSDISAQNDTVIITEFESFKLKPGQVIEYNVEDPVYRGDPVRPGLALAYDHVSRPNWNFVTPQQWRDTLNFSIQEFTFGFDLTQTVELFGTVEPPTTAGKYSKATLSDTSYVPLRGTFVTLIEDNTENHFEFSVVGHDGSSVLLIPAAIRTISGLFQFKSSLESKKLDYQHEYFELSPGDPAPSTLQAYPQLAGSASLEAQDLSAFPKMGRVNVMLPAGGLLEFEYFDHSDTRFLNCHWRTPFIAMDGTNPIDSAAQLRLVAEYRDKLVNPAFSAIVARRVSQDGNPIKITDENIDELYALLKNSSAVLELRSIQEPVALENILDDVIPSGTSLEVIHKDILVDTAVWTINDRTLDYEAVTLTIVAEVEP